MLEFLQSIDNSVFYFINGTLANPLFDKAMPFITESKHWIIAYVILWFIMVIKGGRKGLVAGILIIILIALTDQLNSFYIKSLFARTRPCKTLPGVHLLVGCTDAYSFPSTHAVNNFAAATLVTHFFRNLKVPLFTAATIVALSRIFCGVHYPSDVVGGAIIGTLAALLMIYIWEFVNGKLHFINGNKSRKR